MVPGVTSDVSWLEIIYLVSGIPCFSRMDIFIVSLFWSSPSVASKQPNK